MLDPHDRRLLLDALRPPEGYALDIAIGTTYSLDLMTLLTAPMAFTFFDWEGSEDSEPSPIALLEAVRRHASRIAIFCQAGQIRRPDRGHPLFGFVEDSIVEVSAPRGGVFHPKVWALRFTAVNRPVAYRLLCLTRNLTFDRSWDLALALDGELTDRRNAIAALHPLGEFIAALPRLAVRGVSERIARATATIQEEIRRVRFDPPEGFEKVAYWPLGIPGATSWPFKTRRDRLLVISPFLSPRALNRLSEGGTRHVLVSRIEALDELSAQELSAFEKVYCLAESTTVDPGDGGGGEESLAEPGPTADDPSAAPIQLGTNPSATWEQQLDGLHAKLYVADAGWDAQVWIGSANATDAALDRNVEFLVQLTGKRSACGVDAVLAHQEPQTTFASLLAAYTPGEAKHNDKAEAELEARLESARRAVAGGKWKAEAQERTADSGWTLNLTLAERLQIDETVAIDLTVWPLTLTEVHAKAVLPTGGAVVFEGLSAEAITGLTACRVTANVADRAGDVTFVFNIPVANAPADRQARILRTILRDGDRLLRLLLLLLSEDGLGAQHALTAEAGGDSAPQNSRFGLSLPTLFEGLVKALERDPERIDEIERLLTSLQSDGECGDLLPPGFEEIWQPIIAVRRRFSP